MREKKGLILGLIVVGVLAFFGYPYLQWFRLTMAVRDEMDDKHIGRFPSVADISDLETTFEDHAKKIGYKSIDIERELEYRDMGNTRFWFLKVQLKVPGHSFKMERRVETEFEDYDLDKAREDGVIVTNDS